MPLGKLVEETTKTQRELKALAISKMPEIQAIALELYNAPEKRFDFILNWYIEAGYKSSLAETGNEVLARAQWEQVASMVSMKLDQLATIPLSERGDLWTIAVSIIMSAAKRQAELESGLTSQSLRIGTQEGDDQKRLTKGISKEVLKSSPYEIKASIKAADKAEKDAKKNG